MTQRFDLYAPIHKALRACMHDTLTKLGRVDPTDADDVTAVVAQLHELIDFLDAHLGLENDFVNPVIARLRPAALGSIPEDHDHHQRAFVVLRADATAFARTLDEPVVARRTRARLLYLALSRFIGENLVHMAIEESELNAVLWELLTDAELVTLYQQILASEPPAAMVRAVRWLIPAVSPAERAMIVGGARAGIPAPVFGQLLGQIRTVLTPREWTKLEASLAAPVH